MRFRVLGVVLCVITAVLTGVPVNPASAQDNDEAVEAPVVAVDDVVWTDTGETVAVDVTANDSDDSDDADATVTVTAASADGSTAIVVEEGEPGVEFTPAGGFDGVTTFTYETCVDGSCDDATVTVYVGLSACTIVGTNSADTLVGTDGDDVICGRRGADTIDAGAGNDIVFGGRGRDTITGGPGDDVLRGGRGDDTINAGDGNDQVHGGRGDDVLFGEAGNDTMYGGKGPDTLDGGDGDDLAIGKAGDDTINGGPGADELRGWRGNDTINGDAGNDLVFGGRHADVLGGGDGDDEVRGKRGADTITGGPGNDLLYGNKGADTIHGGDGDDDVRGNRGDDTLDGGNGVDVVNGGNGTDTCDDAETARNCETETNNGEPGGEAAVEIVIPETQVLDLSQPGGTGVASLQGHLEVEGSELPTVTAIIEGVSLPGTVAEDGNFSIDIAFPETRTYEVQIIAETSAGATSSTVTVDAIAPSEFQTLLHVDTVLIDEEVPVSAVSGPTGVSNIVISNDAVESLQLAVGRVLLAGPSTLLPDGSMARIVSATDLGDGTQSFSLEPVGFDEAFTQLKVAYNVDLLGPVPSEIQADIDALASQADTSDRIGSNRVAAASLFDFGFDATLGTVVTQSVNLGGPYRLTSPLTNNVGADCTDPAFGDVCGFVELANPSMDITIGFAVWIEASYIDFRIESGLVAFVAGGKADVSFDFVVGGAQGVFGRPPGTVAGSEEWPGLRLVSRKRLGPSFTIGPVPVQAIATITFFELLRGSLGGELSGRAEGTVSARIVYDRNNGGWDADGSSSFDIETGTLDVTGELVAGARVDTFVGFEVAGVGLVGDASFGAVGRVDAIGAQVQAEVNEAGGISGVAEFGKLCWNAFTRGTLQVAGFGQTVAFTPFGDDSMCIAGPAETIPFEIGPSVDLVVPTPNIDPGQSGLAFETLLPEGNIAGTWDLVEGSLPRGLELDAVGRISGTPLGGGLYAVRLRYTSEDGQAVSFDTELAVNGPNITTTSLFEAEVGGGVNQLIVQNVRGAAEFVGFTVVAGSLPPGLALETTEVGDNGRFVGAAAEAGVYDFTVRATDSDGNFDEAEFQLTVVAAPQTLGIDVAVTPYPVSAGDDVVAEFVLTNLLSTTATDVRVAVELPAGMTDVSFFPDICSAMSETLWVCTVGDMPASDLGGVSEFDLVASFTVPVGTSIAGARLRYGVGEGSASPTDELVLAFPPSGPGGPSGVNPFVVPCSGCLGGATAGDPHLSSLDGFAFDLQTVGEKILVQSADGSVEIQVRTSAFPGGRVSVNSALAADVAGDVVEINRDGSVLLNGQPVEVTADTPLDLGGGAFVSNAGRYYNVVWPGSGDRPVLRARAAGSYMNLSFLFPDSMAGQFSGLLGDGDGDQSNDFRFRDGTVIATPPLTAATLHTIFADAWRISDAESLFTYPDGVGTADFTNLDYPSNYVRLEDFDPAVVQAARVQCEQAGVTDTAVRDWCALDLIVSQDPSFLTGYLGALLPAGGGPLQTVRDVTGDPVLIDGVHDVLAAPGSGLLYLSLPAENKILTLDPVTGVTADFATVEAPTAMAADAAGNLFVVTLGTLPSGPEGPGTGFVTRIDAETGVQLVVADAQKLPRDVEVTPDGSLLYVHLSGLNWFGGAASGILTVDLETGDRAVVFNAFRLNTMSGLSMDGTGRAFWETRNLRFSHTPDDGVTELAGVDNRVSTITTPDGERMFYTRIGGPFGACDSSNNVYLHVEETDPAGVPLGDRIFIAGGTDKVGFSDSTFNDPLGRMCQTNLALTLDRNRIYINDAGNQAIRYLTYNP